MYTWLLFILFPACTHHFMRSHVPCVSHTCKSASSDAPDIYSDKLSKIKGARYIHYLLYVHM